MTTGREKRFVRNQLVPAMVLLAGFGVAFSVFLVMKNSSRRRRVVVATSLILLAVALVGVSECVRLVESTHLGEQLKANGLNHVLQTHYELVDRLPAISTQKSGHAITEVWRRR